MPPKSSNKKYTKIDPREHILHRPEMYVGSTRLRTLDEYVASRNEDDSYRIFKSEISSSPAILRIFVEPLSNAIDNVDRSKKAKIPCTKIKVSLDPISGETSVWNDGDIVPIEFNHEQECYNHSMIFGQLLTGSNYDDEEERVISGRNGLGIKLCLKKGTLLPDFFGNIKKIEDFSIGDVLIGDDGAPRNIIGKVEGEGKLYEVSQDRGNSYIVNENHILTLRMPDHKVIFWNSSKQGWSMLWLNKEENKVQMKSISAYTPEIICPECGISLTDNLNRHYRRIHKDVEIPKKERRSPTITPPNPESEEVQQALRLMEEFRNTIQDNNTIDISIQDYMSLTPTTKGRLTGFMGECVQWEEQEVELDPYVLGLWLGDGYQSGYGFAIEDPEILEYLQKWGDNNDATFKQNQNDNKVACGKAPMKKLLAKYNLINNKHIPQEYIVNSREVRLAVLAGMIDSDGCITADGRRITIAQGMDHSRLASDLIFLAKSLGFMCSTHIKKTQWKYEGEIRRGNAVNINISGNGVEYIPTRVARKRCLPPLKREVMNTGKIRVKKVDSGDFVGLEVDGNNRFVLEDFTVTHNCNVFSTSFRVRGVDPNAGKMLVQEWSNNMKVTNGPVISDSNLSKGFTEVTWTPDFSQFGMKKYSQDIINLYTRYVIDAAMLAKVDVFLNNELIPINSLTLYSSLYDTPSNEVLAIKTNTSDVVITPSTEFQAVSFVNGVYTRLGGQHVDAWSEALFRPIVNKFNKKGKPQLTIKDIKQFFRIFISSTVVNPEFDGQDKNKLENPPVPASVKKTHIDAICKWDVMDNIEDIIRSKEMVVLRKAERKKKGFVKIEGLDPANNAGGALSTQCTLILCEGLSAKTYAVAGIEKGVYGKAGRDWFGVYPLRGKVLNVRNSAPTVIAKNAVITDLIQAIGVRHDVDYTDDKNFEQLRYGKIMIMTDADSVTGDTPILVKNTNGLINVKNIEDLCTTWVGNDKEYGLSDYTVWTECGWSNIKSVMKHKVSKRIYRVVTHTGIVDVTEDHSLLKEDGVKITPQECVLGQTLLHSFPVFSENKPIIPDNFTKLKVKELWKYASQCKIQYYQKMNKKELLDSIRDVCSKYDDMQILSHINVTIEEAYAMGLFFTDGSCGIYEWKYHKRPLNRQKTYTFNRISYSWAISNTNLNYLEKARDILCNIYGFDFKIIDDRHNHETRGYQNAYKLNLNGGKKVKHFIENYRKLFYSGQSKTIPDIILNAPTNIRENFFQGMYDGDGDKSTGATRIDVYKKIGAQAVFLLCKSLGYEVSINCRDDKPDVFTLNMTKGHQQRDPHKIKKLIDLGTTEQYVYDIETDNHHFQAGIGQMIVHNTDGIHIEGLIMNFFHSLFPTLYERANPFVVSMKTPIVRVFRPKGDLLFYDERRFREFAAKQTKNFKKKYYKGLGTTKPEDVPDTFGLKMVEYINDEDTCFNMNKVFHKRHADARKDWLAEYKEDAVFSLDDQGEIIQMGMSAFMDGEMIKFSHDDCKRSIPNGIDGLKESQRKILFAVMKKKLKYSGTSLKVAQLGGYTAEHTNYHHGEQNLFETITKMANEFPGSNNIPLFYRDGQFGTRLSGGKDAASPRYIFTKMDMLTHLLFREEDFPLLELVTDDGDTVEPKFYVPILPMILINGCSAGIGTGWSCNVPCYNPLDLIAAVKVWLDNDGEVLIEDPDTHTTISLLPELHPWYRDFRGTIEPNGPNRYITYGILEKEARGKVTVSELPIGMWTDKFKEMCEDHVEAKQLKSMKNYSTPKTPNFVLTESADGFSCNIETLKLHSYLYTSNMVLFNEKEQLRKFTNVDEIVNFFCTIRFNYYIKRKRYLIESLESEHRYLGNKARFVQEVIDEELVIMNEEEEAVITELEERGYDKDNVKTNVEGEEVGGYDYLLRMQVRTFTANKVRQLRNDIASLQEKIDGMRATTEKQMWINDLNEFQKEYTKWLKIMEKSVPKITKKTGKK